MSVRSPANSEIAIVAEALKAHTTLIVPNLLIAGDDTSVRTQLSALDTKYSMALTERAQLKKALAAKPSQMNLDLLTSADSLLSDAMKAYEAFRNSILQGSEKNAPLLPNLLRQMHLKKKLNEAGAQALLISTIQTGGYYTRRSVWTALAGSQFRVSGSAAISYVLFNPKEGKVSSSGVINHRLPYRSVDAASIDAAEAKGVLACELRMLNPTARLGAS